jgi:hypothetical protein
VIPVQHDLEQMIFDYLDAAGLRNARKDTPLFRIACKKMASSPKPHAGHRHLPNGEAPAEGRRSACAAFPALIPGDDRDDPARPVESEMTAPRPRGTRRLLDLKHQLTYNPHQAVQFVLIDPNRRG